MNEILRTAITYLNNNGRLIYSYRGNTFLQSGEMYDQEHAGRGRIDCSTLVHLALLAIPYEESPYATGIAAGFFEEPCKWYANSIPADGIKQPQRDIISGSCKSGKSSGNTGKTIGEVFALYSDRTWDIRRAYGLARYCRENDLDLKYSDKLKPGDLVFFEAPAPVRDEYIKYGAYMAISHVGIVAEDTGLMINATGRSDQDYNARQDPVQYTRIADKGRLVMAARIDP